MRIDPTQRRYESYRDDVRVKRLGRLWERLEEHTCDALDARYARPRSQPPRTGRAGHELSPFLLRPLGAARPGARTTRPEWDAT